MNSPSVDRVREVFAQWELYFAIIRNNYMLHHDLTPRLQGLFRKSSASPTVLDLGSGDGYMARESLAGIPLTHYQAVDLSEDALQRLEQETPEWNGKRTVHLGDFSDLLKTLPRNEFDIILANYSLHHLSQNQKVAILPQIARILKRTGIFVWTDVVLNEDENRDGYLDRLEQSMRTEWTELSAEQRDRAVSHIRESDFPESLLWMTTCMNSLGFLNCRELLRNHVFGSWVFSRAESL